MDGLRYRKMINGQNWIGLIWTMFILNKTVLRCCYQSQLTRCDYFFCGHVKDNAYAISPMSIQDFKYGIREAQVNIDSKLKVVSMAYYHSEGQGLSTGLTHVKN